MKSFDIYVRAEITADSLEQAQTVLSNMINLQNAPITYLNLQLTKNEVANDGES